MPNASSRSDVIDVFASAIRQRAQALAAPCIVALDGRSGVGKSTLARDAAPLLDAKVLDGDDFFAGGLDVRHDTPAERARDCIDWRRQRAVLEELRAGTAFAGSRAARFEHFLPTRTDIAFACQ